MNTSKRMKIRRPLLPVVGVLIGGTLLGDYFYVSPWVYVFGIVGLVILHVLQLISTIRKNHPLPSLLPLLLALFLAVSFREGIIRDEMNEAQRIVSIAQKSEQVTLTGVLCGQPVVHQQSTAIILKYPELEIKEKRVIIPAKIQTRINNELLEQRKIKQFLPGDRIVLTGKMQKNPSLKNPRVWEISAYLEAKGIAGQMILPKGGRLKIERGSGIAGYWGDVTAYFLTFGKMLEQSIDNNFPARTAEIVKALVLGGSSRLREDRRTFLNTGLFHLFSVSGFHTVMVAFVLFIFFRMLGIPYRMGFILTLAGLLFYIGAVGFPTPALRAFVMTACFMISPLVNRKPDALSALYLSAFLILLVDPWAIFQTDFQLSFGSVLAICLLYPSMREQLAIRVDRFGGKGRLWANRIQKFIMDPLLVSLCVQIGLIPLLSQYYHNVSLIAPITNAISVIVVLWLYIGLLAFLLVNVVSHVLAGFGAQLITTCLSGLMAGLTEIGNWECSSMILMPMPWYLIGVYYIILFGGFYLLAENRPDSFYRRRASWLVRGLALVILLVWYPLIQWQGHDLEITFLDVGQGDATFIQAPDGAAILIDGGKGFGGSVGERVIEPFLLAQGREDLDLVIVTHSDSDHIGGLEYIVKNFFVDRFVHNGLWSSTRVSQTLQTAISTQRIPVHITHRGEAIKGIGGMEILTLYPTDEKMKGVVAGSSNNTSIVLWLRYRRFSAMLTGDAELEAEVDMEKCGLVMPSYLLKAGHHGSRNSSSQRFLQQVHPKVVIISCGENNSYGHPHKEVLERCSDLGARVYRTDKEGAITLRSNGEKVIITTEGKE